MKEPERHALGIIPHTPYLFWKRTADLLLSAMLLLLLSLPLLFIGILVRLTSKGPAIFRQERIGKEGKPFLCYKFRTMYLWAPHDCPTAELTDAERLVTPLGRLLRRASLDELPQLWNVLVGDMSVVGPRPLIPKEEEAHHLRRQYGVYRVRPGITGLAQISGRDLLSDREKARLDAEYVRRLSLGEDLRILFQTFVRVCSGDGVRSLPKEANPHPQKRP